MKILDLLKYRVRKLTPNEYGKLQGFPMERWHQVVSDTQAYKQFGNAVTVSLFCEIAKQIKSCIEQGKGESDVEQHERSGGSNGEFQQGRE
ncbi:MAG: DNA cytosine methyltransferase [Lachnospira sp.]|nr:DNA cytosine methyltransferase [Lachnospira sp.]